MPPVDYRDFHLSRRGDRAFRNLMVATAASLVGVIVGGISMFAVVTALTAPSPHDLPAQAARKNDTAAIAPIVTATPQPAPAESSPSAVDPSNAASTKAAEQTPPAVTPSVQPPTTPSAPTQPTASTSAPDTVPGTAAAPSRRARPDVADQTIQTTRGDRIDKRAGESKRPRAGLGDRHAPARSSAAQRPAAQTETGKRRTAAGPAATEPAPGYDGTAALPPDRTRQFFDSFGDDNYREGSAAVGPDAGAPRDSNLWQRQPRPDATGRAAKARMRHRRRSDDVNVSDRAPPPSGRGRIIVPAQPGNSDDRGTTDFLGQMGDQWSEPTWHH
jgi:hypothetical protein